MKNMLFLCPTLYIIQLIMHYQFTLHLFKDQPEDGPTIGPKYLAGFIT